MKLVKMTAQDIINWLAEEYDNGAFDREDVLYTLHNMQKNGFAENFDIARVYDLIVG